MVLYDSGEAILITGFNQFNIVVMDPVNKKLGYMSRSDASEMLAETRNQVFTYYCKVVNWVSGLFAVDVVLCRRETLRFHFWGRFRSTKGCNGTKLDFGDYTLSR